MLRLACDSGLPFIAGGDWQVELEQLLAVSWVRASGAEAVAGDRTEGTISSHKSAHTIGYSLVTSDTGGLWGASEVLVGILCPPHRTVRFVTMARPREQMVQVIRQLPKVPISSPFGPRAPPTAWEKHHAGHGSSASRHRHHHPRWGRLPPVTSGVLQGGGIAGPLQHPRRVGRHCGAGALRHHGHGVRGACPRIARVVTEGHGLGLPAVYSGHGACIGLKCTPGSAPCRRSKPPQFPRMRPQWSQVLTTCCVICTVSHRLARSPLSFLTRVCFSAFKALAVISKEVVAAACQLCLDIASSAFAEDLVEALARWESRTQWRAWTAEAAEGGAKLAHSWTKETVGWVQQVAKDADGSWSSELNGSAPAPWLVARIAARQAARLVHHVDPRAPCAPSHLHRRNPHLSALC